MKTLEEIEKKFEIWWYSQPLTGFERVVSKSATWNFIESTISQTKQELIEEIYTSGMIADGMYDPRRVVAYVDKLHREVLKTI